MLLSSQMPVKENIKRRKKLIPWLYDEQTLPLSSGSLGSLKRMHHIRSGCQICPPPVRLVWSLVWMWCVRTAAINLTKITFQINLSKAASVFRLLNSQANCFRLLSVDVTRIDPRYMSSQAKKRCTDNMTVKKIGTHNGTFHCDEVLACFFLRQLPEYKVRFSTL